MRDEAYNAYMRTYMLNRYHEKRKQAIERLGGQCVDCGATENLEFDHADAKLKSFNIARIWSYKRERLEVELAKCVLRCKSCHLAKTYQVDRPTINHGGGVSGKRGCKCDPCKAKKSEYNRNYKKTRASNSNGRVPSF